MLKSKPIRFLLLILVGLVLFLLGNLLLDYRVYEGATASIYVIAIASIILLTGFSGQISLGHGALMAIGGYAAVLSRKYWHTSGVISLIIAVLAAALFGVILGYAAARLRGPYLAGTTLALAVGLPSLANQFHFLGGEQGLNFDIGAPPKFLGSNFSTTKWYFWICALAALIIFWLVQNLLHSRYGRQWKAMRSAPVSAALSGINIARSKVLAFIISSGIAGLAGALLVMTLNLVTPSEFPLSLSFAIVTGAVLAGIARLPGAVIGALIIVAIPDLADQIATKVGGAERISANLPGFITSLLLILTILFAPNGAKIGKLVSHGSTKTK
jgi:branched-chain amino acid transport system permease protein